MLINISLPVKTILAHAVLHCVLLFKALELWAHRGMMWHLKVEYLKVQSWQMRPMNKFEHLKPIYYKVIKIELLPLQWHNYILGNVLTLTYHFSLLVHVRTPAWTPSTWPRDWVSSGRKRASLPPPPRSPNPQWPKGRGSWSCFKLICSCVAQTRQGVEIDWWWTSVATLDTQPLK